MSLVLQSTGGGQITIQEPATASNFTQTLPAATGTVVLAGTTPTFNGITFPATQVPSADANTLDDYEEGTWTPTVTVNSGTMNSQTCTGQYTKVGRLVSVNFQLAINTTSAANPTITGLPFAIGNGSSSGIMREATQTGLFWGAVGGGSTNAPVYRYDNSSGLPAGNSSYVGTYVYYTT
jgi:hypothetical protein